MAELQTQNNHKQKGVRRSKKLSTRVDLTPMVDLGFLLITFFIFTTTMSEAKAMGLVLPSDKNIIDSSKTPESKTISFILSSDDKIYYYYGLDIDKMATTNFAADGIRNIIIQKQKALVARFGTAKDMVVLIKPTDQSSYGNVVDLLDEMQINNVKKYVLIDADNKEKLLEKN